MTDIYVRVWIDGVEQTRAPHHRWLEVERRGLHDTHTYERVKVRLQLPELVFQHPTLIDGICAMLAQGKQEAQADTQKEREARECERENAP